MVKIVLDAGHGAGKAFNRGGLLFNEGDQNYKYSLLLKKELEKYKNVEVLLTRKNTTDDPSLEARGKMYPGADLFISIHTNAFENSSAKGTETWVSVRNDLKFGKIFNDVTVKTLGTVDRGVKQRKQSNGQDWYGVLRSSTAKYSLLIENVFHTNLEDSKIYLAKQNELAEAQAGAIANYYNLSKKQVAQVKSTNNYNGFKKKGDSLVYFRQSGTQAFGWQKINGSWYYFRKGTGTTVTGFQYINKRWRYFDNNGKYVGDGEIKRLSTPLPFN